jgi:hypothetical protein
MTSIDGTAGAANVILAQAGIQVFFDLCNAAEDELPAFAGLTNLLFASRRGISTIPERDINDRTTDTRF